MKSHLVSSCELKTGLLGRLCGGEAVGLCQYCGRPFCKRHGEVQEDGQEICSRKFCVAKRDDLLVHLVYKDAVTARNEGEMCGIDRCRGELSGQCIRCRGFFCVQHVEGREEKIYENQVLVTQVASLCHHCWERRPIWLRL
jgi:hypothetical protein